MKSKSSRNESAPARAHAFLAGLLGSGALIIDRAAHVIGAAALLIGGAALLPGGEAAAQLYRQPDAPVEARVRDLLSRMTLEEKFWQLFMLSTPLDSTIEKCSDGAFGFQMSSSGETTGSVSYVNAVQRRFVEGSRLGIPIIPFDEAVHGLVQRDAVVFPQAIALAASFDTSLMHRVSRAIALECRRRGIRQVLSPVVNIASDVRWGRVEETYGEDPYLSSEMGVAFVSEFEKLGVITTPKHFIANVGDGGRDSYPIYYSERLLREVHLPPFEACVRRGGSRSIMASYNSLDGTPCTANDWLLNRLLKGEMGFTGFVISDACAVGGANVLHLTARDYAEATERALKGGLDVIFQTSYDHYPLFIEAFRRGTIDSATIDRAVSRVLRAKFGLGLFEHPYVDSTEWAAGAEAAERALLAREASRRSIVLLKNDGNALPLKRSLKRIAVFGQDAVEARLGGYSGPGIGTVSILDGIREKVGSSARVSYARGCDRRHVDHAATTSDGWKDPNGQKDLDAAAKLARRSDVAVVVAGIEEGEFRDRAMLGLPGRQEELIARIAATGTPVVVVIVGGSAVTMSRWLGDVAAVLDVWYPGEQGGNAVADVLFGDCNPAGRLPVTFPVAEGQLPLVYNHKPTGRGDDYGDLTGLPLFPFGFGLSYTSFEYGDLSFDSRRISRADSAVVRFTVRNAGGVEGDEVVQLYIHDESASVARPVTELRGFARIHLAPGERKEARFTITPESLRMLDRDLRPTVEPGDFRIMIGSSSKDIRLKGVLTVVR